MSRPPSGNGDLARGAGASAVKGAVLIGVAVIGGIFLLQRVNDSKASPSAAASTTPTTVKHPTTTAPPATTAPTTPTTVAGPVVQPAQLRVLVLNGSGISGQARAMRTKLEQAGYTNQPQANTWTGHQQAGTTVMCKPGLAREGVALSQQTALQGSKVVPIPTPPPPADSDVQCIVVVGT
jgi:hypothetical protein